MKLMAALPSRPKKLAKTARKIDLELEDGEILAMVNSGSFLHAIDAELDLPGHFFEALDGKDRSKSAETACGANPKRLGTARTESQREVESHEGENSYPIPSPIGSRWT